MLGKVLVANRGEIALRIMRACRDLGVPTVAVFSEADALAPHVGAADEAVAIGPASSAQSYLVGARIIDAARQVGADAIHPGYGFLSERAEFARAVADAGLVFIGPPASAIAAVGSKTAARALAVRNGVPVVPGSPAPVRDARGALEAARVHGFPVVLKAAAGGGGRGMRVVRQEDDLPTALDAARREAMSGFGDDTIYVEKFIEGPRHVEIQILADSHGKVVSLGERECSVQRRMQKMIEESPSVAVTPALRVALSEAASTVARAAGYVNAGTCEFLLDRAGAFYFLEMNTRLQVEHPVTEMVTGIDVVEWQLRIAAGESLPVFASPVPVTGWAIECRITSEDPANGFLPSTGRIDYLRVPSGPGVRWDGGIEQGSEVTLHYDPLLAKLIVLAPSRAAAITRMRRALTELVIAGVETSRDLHVRIMDDESFRRGDVSIQWLEERLPVLLADSSVRPDRRTVARAAALLAAADRDGGRKAVSLPAGGPPTSDMGDAWIRAARIDVLR